MKNIEDLRNDLVSVYAQLKNDEIGIAEAKHLANVSGKIISTAKAQMEYNKFVGSKTPIKFLIAG